MYPVSIKAILCNPTGDIVLLMNERDEWELPGGRIEIGESPQTCLAREIDEELGLTVSVDRLLDNYLFEVVPAKHVFVSTWACTLLGNFAPRISEEHVRVGTFALDALPDNLPENYRASIAAWRRDLAA